jgi:hypothetical protein
MIWLFTTTKTWGCAKAGEAKASAAADRRARVILFMLRSSLAAQSGARMATSVKKPLSRNAGEGKTWLV